MELSYVGNKVGLMDYLHEEAIQSAKCLDCLDTGRVMVRINTDLEEVKCHCQ